MQTKGGNHHKKNPQDKYLELIVSIKSQIKSMEKSTKSFQLVLHTNNDDDHRALRWMVDRSWFVVSDECE